MADQRSGTALRFVGWCAIVFLRNHRRRLDASRTVGSREVAGVSSTRLPLDKIVEGDPVEVLPSEPRAGSQAGLNGPSGSPTSPSTPAYPTDIVACPRCDGIGEVEDDLWVWTRCYSCWGRGEIEVCAFCLDSGEECDACGC